MERIRRLFPEIDLFTEPSRLLVIDFWSQSEEARADRTHSLRQFSDVLAELRPRVAVERMPCTEESVLRLPEVLANHDCDGVVVLPPVQQDHGTRAIFNSIWKRISALTRSRDVQAVLPASEEPAVLGDRDLITFWSNVPTLASKQQSLEALIVSVVIVTVPQGTPVFVLSSQRLLSSCASSALRESIRQLGSVKYIIEFGGNWPGVQHQVGVSCVALVRGSSESSIVRFFRCPAVSDGALEEAAEDFRQLRRRQGGITKYGYVIRGGLPPTEAWQVEAHHPRWEQYLENLKLSGGICSLNELGSITMVALVQGRIGESPTEWPVISGRQILADGSLDTDSVQDDGSRIVQRYWQGGPPPEGMRMLAGDVCILRFFSGQRENASLRVATMPDTEANWCLGPNIYRFRFRATIPGPLRSFVLTYLRSREAADWLRSRCDGVGITGRWLQELPVPKPDDGTLAAMERLLTAQRKLDEWTQQLADVQARTFSFTSLGQARKELLEVSARAEQRLAAATAAETLGWRARNLYPHPLAFRYRTAEILLPGTDKYLAILEAAEACLTYVALIGCVLCDALQPRLSVGWMGQVIAKLRDRPDNGFSLGDWIAIVRELTSGRQFKSLSASDPFFEVCGFLGGNLEAEAAINSLKAKRDRFAHNERPSESELDTRTDEAAQEMDALYRSVDFLTRYPLREIRYVQPSARQTRGSYTYADLVGDHPIPAVASAAYEGPAPSTGLHIIDQHGRPRLAEPWLVRSRCMNCNFQETYALDRYMRDGRILYKSLERGHGEDMSQRRDDLKQVGIDLPEA